MKIICAPDKFKGSLGAVEAAQAMARGIRAVQPDAVVDLCPIADGGEGTVEAMVSALSGRMIHTPVTGPRGQGVRAAWGLCADPLTGQSLAIIEMAAASGLVLLPPAQRDPTLTSTWGTGQLVRAALDQNVNRIILGIGGSATTDGGCGMAQALGVRFMDRQNQPITQPVTGQMLASIARIDLSSRDPRLANVKIQVACDVTNPLTGPSGAATVYGPQKGATPAQVHLLDEGLRHLAALIRAQLSRDVEFLPGAGAAGGLGAGLVAFTDARLTPGIELVLEAVGFSRRVTGAALCLTGEGRIDGQTASGKACVGVAQAAAKAGVKTIALVGAAGPGAEKTLTAGLAGYRVIGEGLTVEQSMRRAGELLEAATGQVISRWPCVQAMNC